jgi:hypothetical protein
MRIRIAKTKTIGKKTSLARKNRLKTPRISKTGHHHNPRKWDEIILVKIYQIARTGASTVAIENMLGLSPGTLQHWSVAHPAIQEAIKMGREKGEEPFFEYIYRNLSPELRKLWSKINKWSKNPDSAELARELLESQGKRIQQRLFIHALVSCNFNPSEALRRIQIPRTKLNLWCEDPEFKKLIEEIDWHRSNFFESHLMKLVKQGDRSAIIFANKTYNKEKYGAEVKLKVEGKVQHNHDHNLVNLDELSLPIHVRKIILAAIEQKEREANGLALPKPVEILDVDYKVIDPKEGVTCTAITEA